VSAVAHHYSEAVRLLALAPIDTALIAGTPDSAVIAQLAAAGLDGMSLPQLARVLRRPLADTEQLLNQLRRAGHVTQLPTGMYGVPVNRATSSPETSTSTTNVLLAALSHALLSRTAADLTSGTDLHDSHRPERG
jgi:hypothetical protein